MKLKYEDEVLQESPVIVENYRREFNIPNPLISHPAKKKFQKFPIPCLQANMVPSEGSIINGVLRAISKKVRTRNVHKFFLLQKYP